MDDKKFLNEEELSTVVGGLVDKGRIPMAFNMAANRFEHLCRNGANTMESRDIVDKMCNNCLHMSKEISPSERDVNDEINCLEKLYLSLVNTNVSNVSMEARDILNYLKSMLGL